MAETKNPSKSKKRDWIIRIVIFGVLGVVLVLALLDYRAKKQATESGIAWRNLLKEANEDRGADLPLEKLNETMQGSPSIVENDNQNVYTWNGTFREYVITVTYDQFPAKAVSEIEGP